MIDEEMNQDEIFMSPASDPVDMPETTSGPVTVLEPDLAPVPDLTPPMEVISVDELLERLAQGGEPSTEEPADPGAEETPPLDPGDTPAVELGPDTLAIQGDLDGLGMQIAQLTELVADIQAHIARPALTTSFSEYTVTEALLLFLLLAAFLSACARILKGGFSWLRS